MSEEPQIVCKNIWKIFGTYPKRTLENLDHSLSRAEVQEQTGHVIGVNDVSFEIISRLIDPTAGEMIIDGEDIMGYNDAQLTELRRFRMSMVFQHFGLFPHRKVIDNISFGLEIRGMDKKERKAKAMEVLEKVGLHGWADHYPRELSGGMQQRVGLARAMAVDPEILIFDEPFSALDPLIRREMQDELLKIQSEVRKTMIFITHDFLEAIKMGDHIAIMKDGIVVQIGTPEEIVANPVDDYVREFTEDIPRYKVLSVGKIMREASDAIRSNGAQRVKVDAKLDSLIDVVIAADGPLAVVDDQDKIIGEIDQAMILKAMDSRS
jgi:glycine betaine/proline transport system ATP-binding protein